MRPIVKFVTSTGCEACKPAFYLLKRIKLETDSFDIKVVDINERKNQDYTKYREHLPVIICQEEVIAKFKVSETDLRMKIEDYIKRELAKQSPTES